MVGIDGLYTRPNSEKAGQMTNAAFHSENSDLTPVMRVYVEDEELNPSFRYHGARLAAGYVFVRDALEATQLSQSGLNNLESGASVARDEILNKLADAYGVSSAFLETGHAKSRIEILADRLAIVLERAAQTELSPVAVGNRLRAARKEVGYETMVGAAQAHGWKPVTYQLHEVGRGGMPVDRLLGYAFAFDVRPEFLFFGEHPIRQPKETSTDWWEPQSSEHRREVLRAKPWDWLKPVTKKGTRLVVIEAAGTKFRVLNGEKTVLSLALVEALGGGVDQYLFGFVVKRDKSSDIVVLDPTSSGGRYLLASPKGDVEIVESYAGEAPKNPIEEYGSPGVAVPLGKIVGRISFLPD
jgi:hypothetical protein